VEKRRPSASELENYACWQRFSVDVSALLFNDIIRDGVKLVNRLHNADLAIFQDYGPFALGFLLIALFIVVFLAFWKADPCNERLR
jgi:hypothetical protein